jgi:type I restriction enzyme S subunit
MSLPRYPVYKNSGVHLLGDIPDHWEVAPLRSQCTHICDGPFGSGLKSDHYSEVGARVIRLQNIRNSGFDRADAAYIPLDYFESDLSRHSVLPGDLLVAGLGDDRNPVGRACVAPNDLGPALVKADCFRFRPVEGRIDTNFVAYSLSSSAEIASGILGTGTTRTRIPLSVMALRRFAAPPVSEQRQIAAFLDFETARIDELIAEQQRLMELLREKRQAVISHAVTRGLDPTVPMKDSGVPWLGEIPAHWEVRPLQALTQPDRPIMYGIVLPGPDLGLGIPILKGGNVKPSRLNLDSVAFTSPEIEAPYARARLRAGDLVYSIRGTIGDCEFVPDQLDGANITQDVARIAVAPEHSADWIRISLLSSPLREDLACGSLGAAVRGVNIYDLKRVRVPVPPLAEQRDIAHSTLTAISEFEHLDQECALASRILQERRAALISAAVTGQIDVRGWVPPEAA